MPIRPLADIIVYTEAGSRPYGFLGATREGLEYLARRHGNLAHGTTAVIGDDAGMEAELAAIDEAGLQTMTLG